jgi:type II secretory pathway component PulM
MRPQDRRALTVGAIVLVALLGYSRVLKPALDRVAIERRTLSEQSALLARERALLVAAPSFPRLQKEANQALTTERGRLFAGDSVAATAELSSYVSQVATAAGVHLTTVEARTPTTAQGVTRLLADVHGEGSWRQVLAFVRLLEVSGQLVDVTSIRLERGARGGPLGGDLISISATLAGYSKGAR